MTEILSPSNMDPLVLLRDEVKEPDEHALASLRRLSTVALALGPNRTREELLPFLLQYCQQSHVEGLVIVATQLGEFAEAVGGVEHTHTLLPVLEKLAAEEEDRVRSVAVQSLVKIIPRLMSPDTSLMPVINRLANAEWYSTRVSACVLLVTVYPLVSSESQEDCRTIFVSFAADESEVIKVAAAQNLGVYGLAMQQDMFVVEIIPILRAFAKDPKEAVRFHALEACASFAGKLPSAILQEHILPVLGVLQGDKIWRVRKRFGKHCSVFCKGMKEVATTKILPLFLALLKDKEGSVRELAVSVFPIVSQECKVGSDVLGPFLDPLSSDLVPTVRLAFAQCLISLASTGLVQAAQLSRLLQKLCRDESPEVRYEIAVASDLFVPLLASDGWAPILVPLTSDSKWRVRMEVVRKFAVLSKIALVRSQMPTFIQAALEDPVYAIREMCCAQIGQMFVQFGEAWCVETLIGPVASLSQKENYLFRLTVMSVVTVAAPSCGSVVVARTLIPLVETASSDKVANVRIAASHAIRALLLVSDGENRTLLLKLLKLLQEDKDCDVSYFAQEAYHFVTVKNAAKSLSTTLTITIPSSSLSSSSASSSKTSPSSLPNFALFTEDEKKQALSYPPPTTTRMLSPPFPSPFSPPAGTSSDRPDLPPFPSEDTFG